MKTLLLVLFITFSISLDVQGQENIKRYDWDGMEVVWLQDERFPTYALSIYFADGALADHPQRRGETAATLNLLTAGTRRFDQRAIAENLEFYGASYSPYVTHEYSTYSISGLTKDLIPTVKKICHLFADASFPEAQVNIEKNRAIQSLDSLVSDHGSLASRAIRELSMAGSDYGIPVSGKIADIKRIQPTHLSQKLNYLNEKVQKRIYLTGPESVLAVQRVFNEECGWKNQKDLYVRSGVELNIVPQEKLKIILIPVPGANQAQVRFGRFLTKEMTSPDEVVTLTSDHLGSGFTSVLMTELRTKRGLTYSTGAFAAAQRDYGRSGISTSTKNENLAELLNVIKNSLKEMSEGKINTDHLARTQKGLAGSYPFRFESSMNYLSQILLLDHQGRDLSELYKFQERVLKIKQDEVQKMTSHLFDWDQMVLVVVGDKSLEKTLKEFGPVQVLKPDAVL